MFIIILYMHNITVVGKISPSTRALNYYDHYYGSIFGIRWTKIREALLMKSKYVAVLNNFGDYVNTANYLRSLGANNIKSLLKERNLERQYFIKDDNTKFPFQIVTEEQLHFPDSLNVFTHRDPDICKFPFPQECSKGVLNYYPLNGASLMCVLALGLSEGECVLDLCAAPGGKALLALQTLLPDSVIANDITSTRSSRISRVFRNYLPDYKTSTKWQTKAIITTSDGKTYTSDKEIDKILVDAPCTSDRISATTQEKNLFSEQREHERLRLPDIQTALLINALTLVKVGGTVVYSTCSMNPDQNDGVVHRALTEAQINYGITAAVRDLSLCTLPFRAIYDFYRGQHATLGQLIVPHPEANYGPMYFSKIMRTL